MPSKNIPSFSISEKSGEDRATAAILAAGGADGVPALALRYWRSGIPVGGPAEPVFITWLPGVGRFCLTVKYGQYSLQGRDWYIDTRAGLRSTQSPLEQAQFEGLKVIEALRRQLGRSVPVAPALVFIDMKRDRGMERLASRSHVPQLWDLDRCTATLARAATGPHLHQSLESSQALAEISALLERSTPVGVGVSRARRQRSQSTSGPLPGVSQRRQLLEIGHMNRLVLRLGLEHGLAGTIACSLFHNRDTATMQRGANVIPAV